MEIFAAILILCGFSTYNVESKPQSRIIGGEFAPINEYKFIAAINVQTNTTRIFCGGALYKNQYILTAAQCINGATIATVNLGSAKLNEADPNRRTYASSEYIIHPDFNPLTLENDIGLIKLRIPIEFSDYISPITPLATHEIEASQNLRIVGWGQVSDSNSSLSDELQVVHIASILNNGCKLTYGNQIADTMVCIEGNYNEGSCHGDTGSPLLEAYSRYTNVHVGIASFLSSKGCESLDPSGYTRTYPYVNWIENVTRGN